MAVSSNATAEDFQALQLKFTQHMRNPQHNPPPAGIEARRLNIYRELIYNNIEGFIASSFPVLRAIIPDHKWHQLLRDYINRHQSHTPLFPKMPLEFLTYLENEGQHHQSDWPFLLELAHYEWVETALAIDSRSLDDSQLDAAGDLMTGILVLNPVSLCLAYTWPVHEISPDNLPAEPPAEKTYIIVYRNRDHVVKFMVLNAVSAKLIEYLNNQATLTGQAVLAKIAADLQHPDIATFLAQGHALLEQLLAKQVLLGTTDQRIGGVATDD